MKQLVSRFYGAAALALLLTSPLTVRAQTPEWRTALALASSAGTGSALVGATATDAAGNVYLTGHFNGTVSFGSTSLTSAGNSDVFVTKWNPVSNTFAWALRGGSTASDEAYGIAVNGAQLYVVGNFAGPTATFGPSSLPNAGRTNAFVVKLTDAGTSAAFTWARAAGGGFYDYATAVAVSGTSVYVAGNFISATAAFGSTTLTNRGFDDGYVAKLVDAGTSADFAWVQQIGGSNTERAAALAVRGGAVYVAGYYLGTPTLGSLQLPTTAGGSDAYVAKLTEAGSFVWALPGGGADDDDAATALAATDAGVYVAGNFNSLRPAFGNTVLTNSDPVRGVDSRDVFVAKLTDAGTTAAWTWAQAGGGPGYDYLYALAASGSSVYVAGTFRSATATLGATALTNAGIGDVFVARLTDAGPSGSFAWAKRAGSASEDYATALALAGTTVYVAGTVTGPVSFGPVSTANPAGSSSAFLASLTDNAATATAAPAPAALGFYPNPARARVQVPAATAATVLTLTDGLGRTVRTATGSTLSVQSLAPGLYLLHAATPGQPGRSARVVVE